MFVKNPSSHRGNWRERFKNPNNEVHLEIGMGRGEFIIESALTYPNTNFVALERLDKIVPLAIKTAEERGVGGNLQFICADAKQLPCFFDENELSCIYINFCDPWRNKAKWHKRRLTHRDYLKIYSNLLISSGRIEFKTDDRLLFDFSLVEFNDVGFQTSIISYDLHGGSPQNNIMTNYERRFVKINKPICYTTAKNFKNKI